MPIAVQRIAVKAIIINDQGRILVLREAATYGEGTQRGRYTLPGGRIDIGEPFAQGLAREVREETGLTVTLGTPVHVSEWFPVIGQTAHHVVAVFFECRPGHTRVALSEEHDEFAWIDPHVAHGLDLVDEAPLTAWRKLQSRR